jgi:hypothetical protein
MHSTTYLPPSGGDDFCTVAGSFVTNSDAVPTFPMMIYSVDTIEINFLTEISYL